LKDESFYILLVNTNPEGSAVVIRRLADHGLAVKPAKKLPE